jgi:hypothetical protein
MNKLLFELIGFCISIISAPFMAWRYPRTDVQFPLMNALAAVSVAVACIFLTAAFLKQNAPPEQPVTQVPETSEPATPAPTV